MAHGMEGHGTCSLDLKWLLCSSWATQPDSLEEILTHCWSLSAVKASVTRLDYPSVAAGLVDIVEQLVLHHINSSSMRLNTWMEAKVERLTSEGQRLLIGPFVHSCIVKRHGTNVTQLQISWFLLQTMRKHAPQIPMLECQTSATSCTRGQIALWSRRTRTMTAASCLTAGKWYSLWTTPWGPWS